MVLLGAGRGLTTAPGTEAIMGSLSAGPRPGSDLAVNDTTRELGGTLGVAIVGSVFASIYSGHLADAPAIQRAGRRDPRRHGRLDGSGAAGHRADAAGRSAHYSERRRNRLPRRPVDQVSWSPAGITLAAALVVAVILPARRRQTAHSNRKTTCIHRRGSTNVDTATRLIAPESPDLDAIVMSPMITAAHVN